MRWLDDGSDLPPEKLSGDKIIPIPPNRIRPAWSSKDAAIQTNNPKNTPESKILMIVYRVILYFGGYIKIVNYKITMFFEEVYSRGILGLFLGGIFLSSM